MGLTAYPVITTNQLDLDGNRLTFWPGSLEGTIYILRRPTKDFEQSKRGKV